MAIKIQEGKFYRTNTGVVTGPAYMWDGDDSTVEHTFGLPIRNEQYDEDKTLFRPNGTSGYSDVVLTEEAPAPDFVEIGGFYKTRDGRIVGPMKLATGYDDVLLSEGGEIRGVSQYGNQMISTQEWNKDGSVLMQNVHESGHVLVERVPGKTANQERADIGLSPIQVGASNIAPAEAGSTEPVVKLDAKEFSEVFNVVTSEFVKRIDEAQTEMAEKDRRIAQLEHALETATEVRDEWYKAWRRTADMKLNGDNRLRQTRARLKKALQKGEALVAYNDELLKAASEEKTKRVKVVCDNVSGLLIIAATFAASWAIFA